MELNEINTGTKEGKLLVAAVSLLTVSPGLVIFGKETDGRKVTPMEMLDKLDQAQKMIFENQNTTV